jgi:putative peptidoglycan lipid II flippase
MNLSWLIKSESYKRGMALSVVFNMAAKFLLFLLTICIARLFGTNIKTDIYFFIYSSMVLLSGSVNAIDTAVIIPESMRLRETKGTNASTAFLNYFLRIYFLIGIFFIAVIFYFGTAIFASVSKFAVADIELYKNYFIIGSFYFLFQLLINYLNTILVSLKFFTVPMIASGVNSCIVVAGTLLLYKEYDIESVLISGLAAYLINLAGLIYILKKIAGFNFMVSRSAVEKKIWSKLFFSELGQFATLASSYFPLYILSGFNSGFISAMNYGKNIADIPNTLLTAQVANVSGIKMNEQAVQNNFNSLNEIFIRSTKLLVFFLVPAGFFMFVFAQPLVELFYASQHFTLDAVKGAAKFLQLLAITIFSIGVNAMVTRIFIAMQIIKQALFYKIIMNGLLIAAIWLFTKFYGAYGFAYGVIFMNMVNFLSMFFICRKFFKSINYSHVINYTAQVIAINLPLAFICYYFLSAANIFYLYKLIIGGIVYLVIMLMANRFKKTAIV